MPQAFIVSRNDFLDTFLTPIIKISNQVDYLNFEWDDGELKTLVPYENKVFLLASHKPLKNEGDGDTFYLREPNRLRDVVSMMPDDFIPIKVDTAKLSSKTKGFSMNFMLVDPMVGSRGNTSALSTKRAKDLSPVKRFTVDKKALQKIKKTVMSFRSPDVVVSFESIDDSVWVSMEFSGEEVRFDLEVQAPPDLDRYDFAASVFNLLDAKSDVSVSMDTNHKILMLDIEHDNSYLRYIVTQKKPQ